MKSKKGKNKQETTRQLIGITGITDYGLSTGFGELAFFSITPSNISMLSDKTLSERIEALTTVFKNITEAEMMCVNSRENFDSNKYFPEARLKEENNPRVRELLMKDIDFLGRIQAQTAASREFFIIIRLRGMKEKEITPFLNRVRKTPDGNKFTARKLNREELKTLAEVYFEQNVTTESFEEYDGERWTSDNHAERLIKPFIFIIDRKNFLFCNTLHGAKAIAVMFSIIETAKENGLNPYDYLTFIFKNAPNLDIRKNPNALYSLLPWNFQARKKTEKGV